MVETLRAMGEFAAAGTAWTGTGTASGIRCTPTATAAGAGSNPGGIAACPDAAGATVRPDTRQSQIEQ